MSALENLLKNSEPKHPGSHEVPLFGKGDAQEIKELQSKVQQQEQIIEVLVQSLKVFVAETKDKQLDTSKQLTSLRQRMVDDLERVMTCVRGAEDSARMGRERLNPEINTLAAAVRRQEEASKELQQAVATLQAQNALIAQLIAKTKGITLEGLKEKESPAENSNGLKFL